MIAYLARQIRGTRPLWILAFVLGATPTARALVADEIALVVNSRVPASAQLAEFYASQRHIPSGRIITLDLPDADEMPREQYDRDAVPAVRKFLKEHGLDQKVKCLVTFYGVPLRVGRMPSTPALNEEVRLLDEEFKKATDKTRDAVKQAEALAKQLAPDFAPPPGGDDPQALAVRADAAMKGSFRALAADPDAAHRAARLTQVLGPIETMLGSVEAVQRLALPPFVTLLSKPPTTQEVDTARARGAAVIDELKTLAPKADTREAREKIRNLIRDNLGSFRYLAVVNEQRTTLNPTESEASFDSEIACLWWPDGYVRHRWQINPLFWRVRAQAQAAAGGAGAAGATTAPAAMQPQFPRTLMVMRLDGPTELITHDLIATGIRVEKEGLKGQVALDARGKPANDAYGAYDQTLRNLAELLKAKTNLHVTLDDTDPVFAPHSQKDVALYCGWYSLRSYIPGMQFNPGAVGFHIASLELVSLHAPTEKGWVRGLMNDGVVGTLGPVAEPYLHSFPAADEFFPLLLTGKLPLAEVYWSTNPLVSWMNSCIGDPLYTPYAANAPLKQSDVPRRLHIVFETGAKVPESE